MSVAFSAKMTGGNGTSGACQKVAGATSISSTGMTVNSGDTHLVVLMHWQAAPTGSPVPTWDGNSFTVDAANDINNLGSNRSIIGYMVNPTAGNKTLACNWSGTADCYMSAISFSAGGLLAANVNNFVEGTTGTTVTVTATTDGVTVAIWGTNGSTPTTNFNLIFSQADLNPGCAATYQLGGTSNDHTFTGAGGTTQAWCGLHIDAGAVTALARPSLEVIQAVNRASTY